MQGVYHINQDDIKRDPAMEGGLDATGQLAVHPAEFWRQFSQMEISAFCVRHGFYCVPTLELVEWLAAEIGSSKAVEIGSGNGVLANALGIIGTDSKQQDTAEMIEYYASIGQTRVTYGAAVRPMDAEGALRALKPEVVIAAWVTHKFRSSENWRGGNQYGVREDKVVAAARYVFVGNHGVHQNKPIMELPHTGYEFPWLVSRAMNGQPNFIGVWKKGAQL